MSPKKYANAVDLIGMKFGLPDFAYQREVVSEQDKEETKRIIREIKQRIHSICGKQGKNNVAVPFYKVITYLLPKEAALAW